MTSVSWHGSIKIMTFVTNGMVVIIVYIHIIQ